MTEKEKQLAAALAAQAALIAQLEARLQVADDFRSSVEQAVRNAGLMNVKDVLKVDDFDFAGSENARTEMFRSLKRAADAENILSSVLTFAKAVAPIALV